MNEKIWELYQLVTEYAPRQCAKTCYDLLEECNEYILDHVSRNEMKRLQSFKGLSSPSTFVYVVIRNLVKDCLKTKKEVVSYEEGTVHGAIPTPESVFDTLHYDELHETLQLLPSEEQLIMKLRYFDEYAVQEIAGLLHKTPKQTSKKIELIKKKLKKMMGEL